MKIPFLPLLFLLILASSCSKDAQYNRQLQGYWNIETSNGESFPNQEYSKKTFSFQSTDRKEGKVTISIVPVFGSPSSFTGTYTLSDDGKLHIHGKNSNGFHFIEDCQIIQLKKDKLTWKNKTLGFEEVLKKS